ncbi:MAG: hypothetical protein ACLUOJ_05515 [Streptococcus salivarius]
MLEAYLCDLLDKKYKQDVWQGRPIRQVTEVTEPTRTGQKIIVVYFLIMVCGIFFSPMAFSPRNAEIAT